MQPQYHICDLSKDLIACKKSFLVPRFQTRASGRKDSSTAAGAAGAAAASFHSAIMKRLMNYGAQHPVYDVASSSTVGDSRLLGKNPQRPDRSP